MGKFQEKVYNKLPYPFKFILLNLKGYLNVRQRYNRQFKVFLDDYKMLWNANIQDIKEYQKLKLQKLLMEAYKHSDWYSGKMKKLNIVVSDIELDPFLVLNKMPVLKKMERKNEVDALINKKRETVLVGYTSGTTGSPTIDYLDIESINASFALWKRFHHNIGIAPKSKQVRFSGRLIVNANTIKPPFWVYNYFENQLLMSTYHLTENNLKHYVKKLNKFKPKLIDGYPSAIYILSKYINKNKVELKFTPKAIAVTAETLFEHQRIEIEKAFNCQVFNQYASSEGSPFITECLEGKLHLNLDSGVFEFITVDGKPAKSGDLAKLIVTSFINYKTPLIRYSIEDTVQLSKNDKICECGCKMPTIDKIIGREDDILWTEEKGFVGRLDTAYKGLKGIIKGQIVQLSPRDIIINLIIDSDFNNKMRTVFLENLKARLGENINYQIQIVDDIPLGANGKFDAVKRNFELNI